MNFVPCLTWVAKGVAATIPHKLQLSPEELKCLIEETKGALSQEDEESIKSSDEDNETEVITDNNDETQRDEEDFESRYNLKAYDNDDDDRPFFNISNIAVHVDNKDDEYIAAADDSEYDDEKEEEEDFVIKDSDNLLVVGHIEEESCELEIYVYNSKENTFYVHHDIVLPSYPLDLEWLDFHPADDVAGNYVAVGDMTPVIKIWDLDVVEVLEPDYILGENKQKSRKIKKSEEMESHSDAVLTLSWNKHVRNILASGSADTAIILWDLQEQKPLNKLQYHTNKVQSVQWHPSESPFLLSGCCDGFIKLYDCRTTDTEFKSWKVVGEIEKVTWNLFDSFKFFCSTDTGYIYHIDTRNSDIEHGFKAHNEAITGLDMSLLHPNILLSASMDKTLKIWNVEQKQLVKSWKQKVGSIYTARVAPDLELTVAIGGNNASNNLKVIDISSDYKDSKLCEENYSESKQENTTSKQTGNRENKTANYSNIIESSKSKNEWKRKKIKLS